MAGQHSQRLTPKQQAVRDIELARADLARETGLVAEEWSPKAVISRSFERYRFAWIAGGVVAGFAALKLVLPSGSRDDVDDDDRPVRAAAAGSGLLGMLAMPLLALGRKTVMNYGMQFVQSWLQKPSAKAGDDISATGV